MERAVNACKFRVAHKENEWIVYKTDPQTHPTNDLCALSCNEPDVDRWQPFCLAPERSDVTCPIAKFYGREISFDEARKELHKIRGWEPKPTPAVLPVRQRRGHTIQEILAAISPIKFH